MIYVMETNFNNFIRKDWNPDINFKDGIIPYEYESNAIDDITEWQEEKQDVMKTLKHNLHAIDDASYSLLEKAGAQTVTYNNENGMYNVRTSDGATVPITLGALMTDGTWSISYKLDKSVPRQVRKEYLVKEARSKLSELYDRQIIKHEGYRINDNEERGDYERDTLKINAFRNIDQTYEDREMQAGFIAEKMVKSFLNQLAIDSQLDFEIVDVPFDLDMYYKIDFFVRRTNHARGVGIETFETLEERAHPKEQRGIQFTINETTKTLEKKEKQIERVKNALRPEDHIDDIVLISFPRDEIMKAYEKWQRKGQPTGGPTAFLEDYIKIDLLSNVLKGYIDEKTLSEYIMKIY